MLFSLQAICACQVSSFLQHSISNRRRSRKNQDPSKWLCAVSIDAGPSHKKYYSRASGQDVNISYLSFYSGITQRVEMIDLNCLLPYWNYDIDTVFENHRKSLIQLCERNELRLHFEWTTVHEKCQKWCNFASF